MYSLKRSKETITSKIYLYKVKSDVWTNWVSLDVFIDIDIVSYYSGISSLRLKVEFLRSCPIPSVSWRIRSSNLSFQKNSCFVFYLGQHPSSLIWFFKIHQLRFLKNSLGLSAVSNLFNYINTHFLLFLREETFIILGSIL